MIILHLGFLDNRLVLWGESPAQATALLCACIGKQTLAPGVVVGRDLAFWARAMRFAGGLVARQ